MLVTKWNNDAGGLHDTGKQLQDSYIFELVNSWQCDIYSEETFLET